MAATARNPTVAMAVPVEFKNLVARDVASANPMSTRCSEAMTHPSTVSVSVVNHQEASVSRDHLSVASAARVASREVSTALVASETSDSPATLTALEASMAPEVDSVARAILATLETPAISATLRASAISVD